MEEDGDWIKRAVNRFERPLARFAANLTGDVDRARDVVQDAFLKLCRQDRRKVEPILAEWLFTVCRNLAFDVLKKEKRMSTLTESELTERTSREGAPSDAIEQAEAGDQMLALLETLPPSQSEALRLKFQNGFSYAEIARITGKSVSHVGVLIHLGLKTLRASLAEPVPTKHEV